MTPRLTTRLMMALALLVVGSASALAADPASPTNALLEAVERQRGGKAPPAAPKDLRLVVVRGPTPAPAPSVTAPPVSAPPASRGTTYYVSPRGTDGGPCSAAAPCRTLNGGIARLRGGETLEVAGGTYDEGIYDWSGGAASVVPPGPSASQPTTIRAAPGAAVWLKPSRLHAGGAALIELRTRHIVIDGINADLGGQVGYIVSAAKESSQLEFRNMELTNSGHCGVQAGGEALRFRNMHVHHNALGAAASAGGQSCHGFYVSGSNGVYDRLRVHDHGGYGLQFSCDGCGGAGSGNVVQNSLFYNNKQGGVVAGGSHNDVVNSTFYNNGIGIIGYGKVMHNTVYNNTTSGILVGGSADVRDNSVSGGDTIGPHQ